ncbi:MAG TPA: FAD-dependent oxidoreductase [Spirochaetia bacterium]|nr:FAD-dependent oxidoreductase [Spirochaetia bacterium]
MQTKIAPCAGACPVHTDVPGYVNAITRGDYAEAARLIRANNPFAAVCGWVCVHPCEDHCRRGALDGPVNIRALKRFALESAALAHPGPPAVPVGRKVAVVGAGPAGLSGARFLAGKGIQVTVWERRDKPGGQLMAALPVYRLPREVLEQDIELIRRSGVEIVCGVEIGRDKSLAELRQQSDAVLISTGLPAGRLCGVPGVEHPQVLTAICFMEKAARGEEISVGSKVVVIGGGDVAMDAARTARRYGAAGVTLVCLEEREKIPAHTWEVEESLEEGVKIIPGYGPWGIVDGGDNLTVSFRKVLSLVDEQGRFAPRLAAEAGLTLDCDLVIVAIGQGPDFSFLAGSGVAMSQRGPVYDRESRMLSVPGIFICGEAARGPGVTIEAVADGLAAGTLIAAYLLGGTDRVLPEPERIGPVPERQKPLLRAVPREPMPVRPVEERIRDGRAAVELGFTGAVATMESSRCMGCGLGAQVNRNKCKACLTCARVCPCGVPRIDKVAVIPPEECQACGICAANCPAGAITLGKKCDTGDERRAVAVFACEKSCVQVQQLLDGLPVRPGYGLFPLPSAAAFDALMVLRALEKGAESVLVFSCGQERCVNRCHDVLAAKIAAIKHTMEQIGISSERLLLVDQSPDVPGVRALLERSLSSTQGDTARPRASSGGT